LLYFSVREEYCELRLDVTLEDGADACAFEQSWRAALAARRLDGKAKPASVRFRLCWAGLDAVRADAWTQFLSARLSALAGSPPVAAESATPPGDWRGVHIWLAYHPQDMTALLRKSRKLSSRPNRTQGRRR
jgi:hypothetical protein